MLAPHIDIEIRDPRRSYAEEEGRSGHGWESNRNEMVEVEKFIESSN